MSCGEWANIMGEVSIDPHSDEMAQGTVASDDAQRTVLSLEEVTGRTDHPLQQGLQTQVLSQGDDGIQEPLHPLLVAHQFPGTVKVGMNFVHSRAGSRLPVLSGWPGGFAHGNRLSSEFGRECRGNRLLQSHTDYAPSAAFIHVQVGPGVFVPYIAGRTRSYAHGMTTDATLPETAESQRSRAGSCCGVIPWAALLCG